MRGRLSTVCDEIRELPRNYPGPQAFYQPVKLLSMVSRGMRIASPEHDTNPHLGMFIVLLNISDVKFCETPSARPACSIFLSGSRTAINSRERKVDRHARGSPAARRPSDAVCRLQRDRDDQSGLRVPLRRSTLK
ncbi:hypothetical protein PHLGIDRAFT_451267 [Phlebiopsis gigantea 11061_1 CR5-6]|uniref:Uncharacterized protein n=1 Tax=Phlebiopsis gigantea (strain 11061_1 CR5-6) TaxID=745531 RepID=A0A0C3RXI8_PHLG1|nr:hypothetical protein PHLGIDRAFT_451267 [Phlebiopsis gigantea 11061_1 CR5-6]